MVFSQKIKDLREKKKLTQEDLGIAVGSSRPRLWGSRIESGRVKNLKREDANKLALLLDVDPLYFYTEELQKAEDPYLLNYEKLAIDPIQNKNRKEIIIQLTGENRALLRENAYLKSLLLKHKIEVYNADTQNDTV